jgi:hypothetical protein
MDFAPAVLASLKHSHEHQPCPTSLPATLILLAADHAAVGNVPAAGGITLDYDWTGSGLTGTHIDIADLATARLRSERSRIGRLRGRIPL